MNAIGKLRDLRESTETALAVDRIFYSLLIIVVGLLAFWLGRASVPDASLGVSVRDQGLTESPLPMVADIAIENQEPEDGPNQPLANQENPEAAALKKFVASKNSTKYHLSWCGGAKQIKEETKVWFSSKAEAEATGRTPAANCPGI